MIIMLVLQIWVCRDCQVGAIRIFSTPNEVEKQQMVTKNNKSYKEGDLVRKYFGGSAFNFSRTEKGIADDKRRVPSCPDPLHNQLVSRIIIIHISLFFFSLCFELLVDVISKIPTFFSSFPRYYFDLRRNIRGKNEGILVPQSFEMLERKKESKKKKERSCCVQPLRIIFLLQCSRVTQCQPVASFFVLQESLYVLLLFSLIIRVSF